MTEPKVLLVDDEPQVVAGLKGALRREPFEVLTAQNARQALDLLATHDVGVIVADHDMPGMSGTELLATVAREYPATVRIMLTGDARLEVALQAINKGEVYRFFTKPCDARLLAPGIRDALVLRQLTEQSARLLRVARERRCVLDEIESQSPGIARLDTTPTGAIELRPPVEDVATLLAEMEREIARRG